MLQLRDIKKEYRTGKLVQRALDGVSLDLRENEFVAILGPSGSGKTTLLNVIGGLDQYDSGDLIIDGVSTKQYRDRDWDIYRNHRIGFVFQSYNLISHQSILSNVELALTISGVSVGERRRRAAEALEQVGLKDHIHKKPNQLSGGQMQRVAIARALVNDPDILLADEPTGALDSETSIQVMELLKEVSKDKLVVMVTHNNELADQYATRIISIKDGRIVGDTDPFEMPESGISPGGAAAGAAFAGAAAAGAGIAADAAGAGSTSAAAAAAGSAVKKKASLSFLTALLLSFNNLGTKKRRTALVAIAGSIGIIGIALIMALSNGVNDYIRNIEENTVLQYPVTIEQQGINVASYMDMFGTGIGSEIEDNNGKVSVNQMVHRYAGGLTSNDLASLKKFLDSGKSGIDENARAVEYTYNVVPQVFVESHDKIRQVNPEQALESVGLDFNSARLINLVAFYQMPQTEKLYQNEYVVKAGRWAEKYDEAVLVLSKDGSITDTALYPMGLLDPSELDEISKKLVTGQNVPLRDDIPDYTYDDFLGKSFKVINAAKLYKYDETNKIWSRASVDSETTRKEYDKALDLKIVGVVQNKNKDSQEMLYTGINYTPELVEHLSEEAAGTEVVKAQMASPEINIFTGQEFGSTDGNILQLSGLMDAVSIDEEAMAKAFSIGDGSQDINQLLAENFDLSGVDLSGIDFSNIDLSGFDMSNFDLSSLDFSGFDLSNIDMGSVNISDEDLKSLISLVSFNVTADDINALINDVAGGYINDMTAKAQEELTNVPSLAYQYLSSGEALQLLEDHAGKIVQRITGEAAPDYSFDVISGIVREELNGFAGDLTVGIADYVINNGSLNPDAVMQSFSELLASQEVQDKLQNFILNHVDLSKAADKINEISGRLRQQISESIEQAIANAIPPDLQNVIAQELTRAITGVIQDNVVPALESAIVSSLTSLMQNMSDMFTIDKEAFIKAFSVDIDKFNLSDMMTSFVMGNIVSYENNLSKLGYADEASPYMITIYPKDFDSKTRINEILTGYNDDMAAAGEDDKVVTYSDFAGSMMTSVSRIINVISIALIALVAISLVVSAIMISVITHISVLERRKEIGILRALGASKRNIGNIFNAETFITGLLAGSIGIGVSLALCALANYLLRTFTTIEITVYLTVPMAMLLIALSIGVNVISGLIPAYKASKSDPVIALRGE